MKKILFVMRDLSSDGAVRSLISLLHEFDFNEYEIDLFLFEYKGLFCELVPKQVNIITQQELIEFLKPLPVCIKNNNKQIISRIIYSLISKITKGNRWKHQYAWKIISKVVKNLDNEYDAAIAYNQDFALYHIIEKVNAKIKIGWIHNDYPKTGMDKNFDKYYFNKIDYLVTVSEQCATSLIKTFCNIDSKVRVIYNITSKNLIYSMAKQECDWNKKSPQETRLLTIARLTHQKGLDFAIETCDKLIKDGYTVKWYIIGRGMEEKNILKMIDEHNLNEHFILLGEKLNPYPYIKNCDIYVQTSRYEGKSIAIEEAKILQKPIVVTKYPTVCDQIEHNFNGIIVPFDSKEISSEISQLIDDPLKMKTLKKNLEDIPDNIDEINKLYELINIGE